MRDITRFLAVSVVTYAIIGGVTVVLLLLALPRAEAPERIERVKFDFENFATACALFSKKEGRWPKGWHDLESGPFLDRDPIDPWGGRYIWIDDKSGPPSFMSFGADLAPGGDRLDTDLFSRDFESPLR